jgi:hypothetical protein
VSKQGRKLQIGTQAYRELIAIIAVLLFLHSITCRDLMAASSEALTISGQAVPFIGVSALGRLFGNASTIPISVASLVMNLIQVPATFLLLSSGTAQENKASNESSLRPRGRLITGCASRWYGRRYDLDRELKNRCRGIRFRQGHKRANGRNREHGAQAFAAEAFTGKLCRTQMRRETSTSGNTRHSAIQVACKICLRKVQGLVAICWSQRNANAFRGGLIALGGNTADRDQNIGLRIVCGSAPAGNRIWDDRKAGCLAQLSFKVTAYVHDLTGLEISCLHINRIQEEHPATIKDAPIAVIQSIDRGIVLIVAANRCQKKLVRLQVMLEDWANA